MKKRIMACFCVALMMLGLLCGCGGKKEQAPQRQDQEPVLTPATPSQEKPAAQPSPEDTYTVYAYAPDGWEDIRIWAWSDQIQRNLFDAWPGEAMNDDGYGWYSYELPEWADKVIINGNGGSVQTADLEVDTKDLWIVVFDDASVSISYADPAEQAQWENVQPQQNGYYNVYAKVNTGWTDVAVWAWSETEGDLVPTWPGVLMEMGSDGWYVLEVPVAYDNVIINGNGGSAQTEDLYSGGNNVWITVDYSGTDLSFTKPSGSSVPAAPAVQSSTAYDQLFSSRGIPDVRVVASNLNLIAGAGAQDGNIQKYEYGYSGDTTVELGLTIYLDISGIAEGDIEMGRQWLQDTYGTMTSGMGFCKTSCDRIGNYLRYIMYFRNLDNPANARQVADFLGVGSSALTSEGLIPVVTAAEMEQMGLAVKYG